MNSIVLISSACYINVSRHQTRVSRAILDDVKISIHLPVSRPIDHSRNRVLITSIMFGRGLTNNYVIEEGNMP